MDCFVVFTLFAMTRSVKIVFVQIPLLNLKKQHAELQNEIETAVIEVLRGAHYVLGPNVEAFEAESAEFLGAKHAIGCANGSDALYLALMALGVQAGDEVLTTPFTYIATAEAINQIGAVPVFVDIDARSYNIDPNLIEAKITAKTRAIIVVHLYGQCCNMDAVMKIAAKHNLRVVEDSAQAFGASMMYQGKKRKAGTIGDIGTFSFYPTKNLSCAGDGGLMTTNSSELNQLLRKIRVHGTYKRYHHDSLGVNSRLDELQAAILRIKLKHIDNWNNHRRIIAGIYNKAIAEINENAVILEAPYEESFSLAVSGHIYHQYTLRVLQSDREILRSELAAKGIATEIYYPLPLHMQPVYHYLGYKPGDFPLSQAAAGSIVCLPISAELELDEAKIVAAVLTKLAGAPSLL